MIQLRHDHAKPVWEEVGEPLQSGKKLLCVALSLLILTALLLPNREAYAYTAPDFRDAETISSVFSVMDWSSMKLLR